MLSHLALAASLHKSATIRQTVLVAILSEIDGFYKINILLALQAVALDILLPPLPTPVVIGRLRLRPTQPTQNLRHSFLHSQSWQLLGDCFPLIPSQMSTLRMIRSYEICVFMISESALPYQDENRIVRHV